MKDQEFKDIWRSLDENPGMPITGKFDAEQFKNSRSLNINDRVRRLIQTDLWIKMACSLIILLDMALYINNTDVLYACAALLTLLGIFAYMEFRNLQHFNRISDPATSTRATLSETLIFLQRKSGIMGIHTASTMALGYFPAIFAYFYLAYGYLKPMTVMSFFVFSGLALIGAVMSYMRIVGQVKHYIKHITIIMSDLNDDILQLAYNTIEKDRKRDETLKIVVGLLVIFAFALLMISLKKITG